MCINFQTFIPISVKNYQTHVAINKSRLENAGGIIPNNFVRQFCSGNLDCGQLLTIVFLIRAKIVFLIRAIEFKQKQQLLKIGSDRPHLTNILK